MPVISKPLFVLIICIILFPALSPADNFSLSGFIETGRRSQAEDFEEEEDDSEYTFSNYHIKIKHNFSELLRYEIGTFFRDKDYETDNALDNTSRILNAGGSYNFNTQGRKNLKLDLKVKYKEKRYENTPSNEYDQISFAPRVTYSRRDLYTIYINTGINNYHYLKADDKDQFKLYSKLGARRHFSGRDLTVVSSYRFETTAETRQDRRKNKNDFMAGIDYKAETPLIQKITSRVKFGQRDTKDDDLRDEDFDYTYGQFYLKTDHRIHARVKTALKYSYFKKDYLTADLDHSGFSIRNTWRYRIFSGRVTEFYANLSIIHKYVDYTLKSGSDYEKDTLEIRGTYRKKNDWKASLSLKGSLYDHEDSGRDRDRYYAVLALEKPFMENELVLFIKAKYKYTDNRRESDTEEKSARLAFLYTF
jgi:hypothetical protein